MTSATDALSQYCTFTVGGRSFAVGVQQVQEVIRYQRMTAVPLAHPAVSGLINLRGQIVTAIELRQRLDLPEREPGRLPMNVVIKRPDGPVSLLVDDIDDVVEIDPATIEPTPPTLRSECADLVAGVHQMEGRLLHILDTERAVSLN
jgi:purine-binding chemotaxis protein CheW